jgi:ABC-type bacteriocin/lantibiotic exporter with double-glycine peptidase domain
MSLRAERSTRGRGGAAGAEPKKKRPPLRKVLPEIWTLIKPRRWLLAFGFVLMVINRVSGLVLPASTKFLVDNVLVKRQAGKLPWIVGAVLLATTIQAITSFSLTQLLSKAAQRLIADLRMQVQQHIGRLSVSFYDATRTGVLVSRIMTDVEGVRNLIGTGLVDFVGGLLTAVLAFFILMRISATITLISFAFVLTFVFILRKAFA